MARTHGVDLDRGQLCETCVEDVDSWFAEPEPRDSGSLASLKIDQEKRTAASAASHEKRTFSHDCAIDGPEKPSCSAPPDLFPTNSFELPIDSTLQQSKSLTWKPLLAETDQSSTSFGIVCEANSDSRDLNKDLQPSRTDIGASLEFQRSVIASLFKPKKKPGRKPNVQICYICQATFPYKKELITHLGSDHGIQRSRSVLYKRLQKGGG